MLALDDNLDYATLMRSSFALTLLLTACASIQPVAYTANPTRIDNPKQEIVTLIKANVSQGCLAEPSFESGLLVVKFVCSRFVGNQVVRLDRVERIFLQQYEEWYRVVVHHSVGEDFTWSSKSLDDMQRMADAFTALTSPRPQHSKPNSL